MRCVRLFVCAGAALSIGTAALGAFDAIGPTNASTSGEFWLTSGTNTDPAGDAATACGVGPIVVAPGHRVTEVHAVIGTRGPGGAGSINFAGVNAWQVHFWSTQSAFGAAPTSGDIKSLAYPAPTAGGYTTPFGTDSTGRPTYLVKFRLPGGITPGAGNSYFAIRANVSGSTVGSIGVLESDVPGASGLWASASLPPPGYLAFNAIPLHAHNGVFAYRVVTGCGADYDGNGTVNVGDIFAFLGAWFAGSAGADYNGASGTTVPDIFAFLNAWFGGC